MPSGDESGTEGPQGQQGEPAESAGSEGSESGQQTDPLWETKPAGGGGEDSESTDAGGSPGDESWESGGTPGTEDGWETSNQIPGVGDSQIPPMPSERDLPAGRAGDGLPPEAAEGSVAAAEGELDQALEDFDGEILAERAVIQARSNEGAGTIPVPINLPSGPSADEETAPDGSPVLGPRGIPSERSAPPAPVAGAGRQLPEDLPDAKDDDIIARQLREAAMSEPDPVLREKLWDEYRRYKGA